MRGGIVIKNVLIITSSIDYTVDYMISKYCDRAAFYRCNVDWFGKYEFSVTNSGWSISCMDWNNSLSEKETYSIYYRKPRFPDLTGFEIEYTAMIQNDILSLINGIVDSFRGIVLTKPCILRKCENKVYQLSYASTAGFLMPKSYIGNAIGEAKALECYKTIIKPICTGKVYKKEICEIYQTSIFDSFDEDISLTPIYLQEYEAKFFEVRVTIVNKKIFPVKIESKDAVDWRRDYEHNQYSIINVPDEITDRMLKMMDDFDIGFGAFDFIVNSDGKWIFLEVNPNGQWQWLECALKLDISAEIINYLIGETI